MGKLLLRTAFILMLLAPTLSWGALDFEDAAFPEFVTSARALALGNAYICKVDDSWSAFYNPAGLGTIRHPQFHIANVHLEASNGLLSAIGDGPAIEFPRKYVDSFDPVEMRSELADNQGKLAHSRINLFPNITVRGMTLGYMYSQRNRSIINTDTANNYEIAERKDHGPVFALNASLFGGVLKLGASAVYLIRRDMFATFGPTEPVDINSSNYRYGKSLQVTGGARLTLPATYLPTFAAVIRNATANDFEDGEDGGLPAEIKQTVDLGFSITPQIGQITRLHMEVNMKDVGNQYETDSKRRLAAGVELDFNRRLFIRGGYGDGWGSGGLGIRGRTVIIDFTTYAIDRSLEGFREEEDRRYVFSFSTGF